MGLLFCELVKFSPPYHSLLKAFFGTTPNKTNGSPSMARGSKPKLVHGMPANSNLAKGSQKKNKEKGACGFLY